MEAVSECEGRRQRMGRGAKQRHFDAKCIKMMFQHGGKKKSFKPFGLSKIDQVSQFTDPTTDFDGSRSAQRRTGPKW